MKKVVFNIDVVSACNLHCPSCPMGNSKDVKNPTGLMSQELLGNILDKASSECEITFVGLFNWTEPLIHPRLADLVELTESYAPCHLSSNLNLSGVDYEALLRRNPSRFRISLSGYNQAIYSRTHGGGDIEIVKRNMAELSKAAERVGGRTQIEVLFHRYLGNTDDERLMKEYSEMLGFIFEPVWAFLMPIEKILQHLKDPSQLSLQDKQLIELLALPPDEKVMRVSRSRKVNHCKLLEDQITLNCRGVVQLCCGLFDQRRYSICNYMDRTLDEIQIEKRKMSICRECMSCGIHNLALYDSPKYDRIAKENVMNYYKDLIEVKRRSIFDRLKGRVRRIIGS